MRRAVSSTVARPLSDVSHEMSAKSMPIPHPWQRREISRTIGGNISACRTVGTINPMCFTFRATNVPTPFRAWTSPIPFNVSTTFTAVRCDTPKRVLSILTDGNGSPGAYRPERMLSRNSSATFRYLLFPSEWIAISHVPHGPEKGLITFMPR